MWVPNMLKERAQYKPVVACWHALEGVGLSLREYYAIPTELLSRLLRLVSKLDAIEGKYLSSNLDVTRDPPDEPNREEKETLLGSCRPAHVNLSEKSASPLRSSSITGSNNS